MLGLPNKGKVSQICTWSQREEVLIHINVTILFTVLYQPHDVACVSVLDWLGLDTYIGAMHSRVTDSIARLNLSDGCCIDEMHCSWALSTRNTCFTMCRSCSTSAQLNAFNGHTVLPAPHRTRVRRIRIIIIYTSTTEVKTIKKWFTRTVGHAAWPPVAWVTFQTCSSTLHV